MNRDEIVKEIRCAVRRVHPELTPERGCVYLALATVAILRQYGIRASFQAGSSSWPRIRPEEDDGVINTHFSYVWEPRSKRTLAQLAAGVLPEMHAWAAIPATVEIIDLSTCYLPEQCRKTAGMAWTAPAPPDYLWTDKLPEGVLYRPELSAIQTALNLLKEASLHR